MRRFSTLAALALFGAWPAQAKSKPAPASLEPAAGAVAAPTAPQNPIILDPGHGGEDWGAVVGGRQEKDIALAIARKLQERLGVPAKLTRERDVYIPLDERISKSIQWGGSAFISLHINQVKRKSLQGITVYAFGKSPFRLFRRKGRRGPPPLPSPPREKIKDSGALARSVVRTLSAAGFKVDPIARAEYYVLKNPKIPSILIELGYLSNPTEAARLSDPSYQDRLADALARSLSEHLASTARPKSARNLALAAPAPR